MNIRTTERYDKEHCFCGDVSSVVLEINNIDLVFCVDCWNELSEEITKFNSVIRCHQCKYFGRSKHGWNYGGTCLLQAEKDGKFVEPNMYGTYYCKDCMDSCASAEGGST